MSRWHRGDRVVALPTGQRAVVDGWKGNRVLLHFGTIDRREVRVWFDDVEVVPAPETQGRNGDH